MKRLVFILLIFISMDVFSQIKVKDGSFKEIEGYIMTRSDKTDDNDTPLAMIRIYTENLNSDRREKFKFNGNGMTFIYPPEEDSEFLEIYLSAGPASGSTLVIIHSDCGKTEFTLPVLRDYKGYEMTLEYVESVPETGFLAISSEPSEADVYVDGKHYGKTTAFITDLNAGTHELKLEKQGYVTVTKNIVIQKGETLKLDETLQTISSQKTYLIVKADQPNALIYIDGEPINTGEASKSVNIGSTHTYKIECNLYHEESGTVTVNERMTIDKKLRPNFGYINISTSPEQGAKIYVDGDYIGLSPIKSDKLASGSHTVRAMKDMYKMKEQPFVVNDGQTTNATITMSANFVNVTINTDSDSDIYVDEEYKGKGRWTGRLSDGLHNFEARKVNHRTTKKSLDLVMGENVTVSLDKPQPIKGSIDVNSSPMSAEIYIDGKHYGQTPNFINDVLIGTHTLKLEKQGCASITKTITIKENETLTINEKLQTGKEITISTDKAGDEIYVDDNYLGLSPITANLPYGVHVLKAVRDSKEVSKTISVSQSGGDNSVKLTFKQEVNGHEYVDLGLSVKWATCNVGASSPEDYGNYYAWGDTKTKSEYSSSNSVTRGKNLGDIKGDSRYDAARSNWGGSWRLPTKAEMEELKNKCTWKWTTQGGKKGYKVTGPNGNSIFLPAAGYRYGSSLYRAGEYGLYWSSTPYESGSNYAYYLSFYSSDQYVDWYNRNFGLSVRPVTE